MQSSIRSRAVLGYVLLLSVIGASEFGVLPLLAAGAAGTFGFSERQVGIMSFAINLGSGASALLAVMWVRSVRWPLAAALALGGMFAANYASMVLREYWAFVLVQGAAGFCCTAVFCLAMTILSDRSEPTRMFGAAAAAASLYQVIIILAGPTLLLHGGINTVLAILGGGSGLALFFAPLLPARGRTLPSKIGFRDLSKPATIVALLAFGIFYINAGAYWTYIELIGAERGMTERQVAECVAAGVAAGSAGALAAWIVGDRFGRLGPIIVATAVTIVAALVLNNWLTVAAFVVSGVLYFSAWNCALSYQLSTVNAVDATGRAVAVAQTVGFIGLATGAGIASIFVTGGDYRAVTWIVSIAACGGSGLFVLSAILHNRSVARGRVATESM